MDDFEIGATYSLGHQDHQCPVDISTETATSHHKGPVLEGLITDKRSRQKSFSKILGTFEKQGKYLYTNCGARQVSYTVVAESGRVITMTYPPRSYRNVKLQVGEPSVNLKRPETRQSIGTPTKKREPKTIKNLPGKKIMSSLPPKEGRIENKCAECKIKFGSKQDKQFKQKNKLQGTWLGCDMEGCGYWAHAMCSYTFIESRKPIAGMKFASVCW